MRYLACTLCAGLATLGLAVAAQADPTTYTFDIVSSVPPDATMTPNSMAPSLTLTFAVDAPVSFDANSGFADDSRGFPPTNQVAYPFPSALTTFDLSVIGVPSVVSVTLADFVSPRGPGSGTGYLNFPQWTFGLTADPAKSSASLSLFYLDSRDSFEFYGLPVGSENPAQLSTGTIGTLDFGADWYMTSEPASYTGILTDPVPEPGSLWLLLCGIGVLGFVRRRAPLRPPSVASPAG